MGASAGAIRAGQAFVELFVKDEIAKGLAKAQRTLKSWGNSLSSVGRDLMAGGAAVLAPMTAAVKMFSDAGHELETLSKKTGMSVEWLSAMQYAVGQLGGEFDGFDIGIKKMQNVVADAGRGAQPSVDAIERLGLSVQQVATLSPEQQFMTIGDALNRIQDPAQRAAAAVDLFGRTGTQMLPVFSEGAAGVERFMSRARELGVVMSSQMAKDAGDLHHQMEEVWMVMKSAGNAVAEALVPTLKELGEWISRNVQAFRAWAAEHQEAIQWAFKLAAAAVAVGGALVLVSVPLRAVAGILAGLRAVTIATTAAVHGFQLAMVAASAHPVIAALTVIAAIVAAIAMHFYLAKKAADDFAGAVSDLKVFQPPDVSLAKENMKSLQELSGKGPLDAAGMKEAKRSIEDIKAYGFDLGITIDETTGSINGMTEAWDKFATAAKDKALESLSGDIARLNQEIDDLYAQEQKANKFDWSGHLVTAGSDRLRHYRDRDLAARKAIEETDAGTFAGKPLTTGSAFDKSASREIEREIAKAKVEAMKDAEAKELTLLELEHVDRVAKAKEVGADLAKLEELFQLKRTNIVSKYADERRKAEREEAKKRFEEDAAFAEERDRQAQSEEEARASAAFDLKKLYIEATKEGKDKELALLEVEKDAALKRAFEEGVPEEYVNAAFEIKRAMVEAADAGEKQKSATVGMFSPARLEALGVVDMPQQRTAKATEEISVTTKKMLDELMLQRQWNVFE
jgi:hypothetical protein